MNSNQSQEIGSDSGFGINQGEGHQKKSSIRSFLEGYPRWKEAVFLTTVAGMSMLFGFGTSVTSAKKQDPEGFDKGFTSTSRKFESGTALATRALKWGTFYAVTGCGLVFFAIWKLSGAKDLQEFRLKAGQILPRIPKNEPQGRTEFANLTDLLQYVIDEDNLAKEEKKKALELISANSNSDLGSNSSQNSEIPISNAKEVYSTSSNTGGGVGDLQSDLNQLSTL